VVAETSLTDWVIVASRQRSSSTSLARAIAQRLGPCAVFVDEMLHHHFPTYSLLGGWSSRPVHYRRSDPLGLARAAHAAWSNRVRNTTAECRDAHVTLVMKIFDVHKNVFLNKLFTHRRACTVILERDAASEECSLRWAAATGDWGEEPPPARSLALERSRARHERSSTARAPPAGGEERSDEQRAGYAAFRRANCSRTGSVAFRLAHDAWFARVRAKLREARAEPQRVLNASFVESTRRRAALLERVARCAAGTASAGGWPP
jgi:hypothetical protein